MNRLIKFLSAIQLIRKKGRMKKQYGITPSIPSNYKEAYYDLLEHIYKNNIYLIDRFVYLSPTKQFHAKSFKESLAISMFRSDSDE
ncbi:hypothetical protein LJB88_04495 [Erysipelotrichaceae bacterium OttesenSCG-928-M19]|nr:hypothetical protein [Erysipelotrichaceae bacterium OttesenSCG-928-M19]